MGNVMTSEFILSVDLGKVRDFTAIAILEKRPPPTKAVHPDPRALRTIQVPIGPRPLHLRHLERVPKGTTYPAVVELVKGRLAALTDGPSRPALVVDHTGVGVAVVDLFEAAKLQPYAITITGGDTVSDEGRHWRVPKRELVTSTQLAMQNGRLRFAATLADLPTLEQELASFNYKLSDAGHDSYASWRERDHDDLVLAVAMAVWYADYTPKRVYYDDHDAVSWTSFS